MGFLAPALPWIGKGAALLGGWLGGRKAQSSAMQRSPEEQTALSGAQGAAGDLGGYGRQLFGMATPALGQATNYWQTLLGGNRAAMAQATAGPRAALTDQYRGAERGLERSGLRGGVRDLASAELSRDRASKIAGLTTGVQPGAAEQLGNLGQVSAQLGIGAAGAGANIWQHLLQGGFENRKYGRQEGQNFGAGLGGLIFDILSGVSGGRTGGSGGSTRTTTFDPITGSRSTDVEPRFGSGSWGSHSIGDRIPPGLPGSTIGGAPWWQRLFGRT